MPTASDGLRRVADEGIRRCLQGSTQHPSLRLLSLIDNTLARLEALPEDATDADYGDVLGTFNHALAGAIGTAMFLRQTDVARLALRFAAGTMPVVCMISAS